MTSIFQTSLGTVGQAQLSLIESCPHFGVAYVQTPTCGYIRIYAAGASTITRIHICLLQGVHNTHTYIKYVCMYTAKLQKKVRIP